MVLENFGAQKRIIELCLFEQIDRALKQLCQLVLHRHPIPQTPRFARQKCHQQIDITLAVKISAQNGTEESQLCNLPALAKVFELGWRDRQSGQ